MLQEVVSSPSSEGCEQRLNKLLEEGPCWGFSQRVKGSLGAPKPPALIDV